jgi:hypothetical protein
MEIVVFFPNENGISNLPQDRLVPMMRLTLGLALDISERAELLFHHGLRVVAESGEDFYGCGPPRLSLHAYIIVAYSGLFLFSTHGYTLHILHTTLAQNMRPLALSI